MKPFKEQTIRLQKNNNTADNKGIIVFGHTEKYLLKRIISFCKSLSIISGSIVIRERLVQNQFLLLLKFIAKRYSIIKRMEIVFDKQELAIKLALLNGVLQAKEK
uniref:Uncharacterized protein n=1 Tax=Glossina palpalis gambiensis TaxID=67801 RepID=A0A1B0ARG2_9MUSC